MPIDLPETIDTSLPHAQPVAFTTTRNILATLQSHPLADDLKVINKVSQNLHVEMLMRQLGRAASPYPNSPVGGSIYGGTNVVRRFLINTVGVPPGGVQYVDGSGMSPHDLVTPATLVQVLRWARRQAWYPLFYDTLPVAGVDGSLAHRYVGNWLATIIDLSVAASAFIAANTLSALYGLNFRLPLFATAGGFGFCVLVGGALIRFSEPDGLVPAADLFSQCLGDGRV